MKTTILTLLLCIVLIFTSGCHSHLMKWEVVSDGKVIQSGYTDMLDEKSELPFPTDTDPHFTGTLKTWHEDGQLATECHFKDGKMHGTWLGYYGNGKKHYKWKFQGNDLKMLYWHINGNLESEMQYVNEKKSGVWRYWNTDGKFTGEEIWRDGVLQVGEKKGKTSPEER